MRLKELEQDVSSLCTYRSLESLRGVFLNALARLLCYTKVYATTLVCPIRNLPAPATLILPWARQTQADAGRQVAAIKCT